MELWWMDLRRLLLSRRTIYSIMIMVALALLIAIVVALAPQGLKDALSAAAPNSSIVYEYLWMENAVDKLLILIFVSFGSYAVCDLEDDRTVELVYSRPQTRLSAVTRRLTSSLTAFLFVFISGSLIAAAVGSIIVGELNMLRFVIHQIMVLPMCLFVISLTFFLSVPLRTTAPTVVASFGISLALSFTYTFLLMAGDQTPSVLNPTALGYRILLDMPIEGAVSVALLGSLAMLGTGLLWFTRKDI